MSKSMIKHFWPDWNGNIRKGDSGWNNTTRYVENKGLSCVLRIYETHRDRDKIAFEHELLDKLKDLSLPFQTPVPVRTPDGETIMQLEDGSGRYACLFEYIEGRRPEDRRFQAAHDFGVATATLVSALAGVKTDLPPAYRPYYELQQSYPSCTPETVRDFCENPPKEFRDLKPSIRQIGLVYEDVEARLDRLRKLPRQLVHGDLNPSNLLVVEDRPDTIAALLDFEFCTQDVRAMEPAVVIADLLGNSDRKKLIPEFCEGFGSKLRLEPEEISAIPVLLKLRKVDVFLHFLSRFENGTDGPDVLRAQIATLSAGLDELKREETWIREVLRQYLLDWLA